MKKRKRRPNWPYRFAWLGILGAVLVYVLVQTLIGGLTFANRPFGIDWQTAIISSLLDATIASWFVAVGASIGSFLNVVAYRLPIGRNIGGHSSCPYCRIPIDGTDNVPVLAWVKLRGRCRYCRLPISAQYPLVELTVALVFLVVYLSEFLVGGGNLPGERGLPLGVGGLARINVSSVLVVRLAVYLFALSGLIAAALIAVKQKKVPLSLYLWCFVPQILASLILPEVVVIRWREIVPAGVIEARLDVLATVLCGSVAGVAMGRLLSPLLYPGFDRSLMASDLETRGARQFVGALAVAGALVGWQSVVPLTWTILLSGTVCTWLLKRFSKAAWLADLTVWVWLGLLLFRASWKAILSVDLTPQSVPDVFTYVLGALLAAPLAIVFRKVARTPSHSTAVVAAPAYDKDAEHESGEEDDDSPEDFQPNRLEQSDAQWDTRASDNDPAKEDSSTEEPPPKLNGLPPS